MPNRIQATERRRQKLQFEITDLTGGFVAQAASYNIDEKFLEDIQNMELVQGMWQKRKGFNLAGTFTEIDPVPGKIRGAHLYNGQGGLHLLVASRGNLYATKHITGEKSGKVIYGNVPESPHMSFVDFRNDCYIAHGEGRVLKFNGSKVEEVPSPKGNILTAYDNRVLLSGIKGDPLVIYFSDRGRGNEWNALSYIALDGKSSEKITALIPAIGKLFIFTNHAIYSLVGSMDNFAISLEVSGTGPVSSSAVGMAGNRFYFIGADYKIYEFDGGNYPKEISINISHYLTSSFPKKALEDAIITNHKDGVWFTLNDSSLPEERTTLVYYPSYQAWTKFKGIPAAAYFHLRDTLYFIGSHNIGSIYQYGTNFNDDFRQIVAHLKTSKWSFNALENLKRFKKLYLRGAVQSGGGNGFDVEFWVDGSKVATVRATSDIASETEIWGENDWGGMYWGSGMDTSGSVWGQFEWGDVEWSGSKRVFAPRWGGSSWNHFNWGDQREGALRDDVGKIYKKIFLSQYNVISGKYLQLVFRDSSPNHGFRVENILIEYVQKGAR